VCRPLRLQCEHSPNGAFCHPDEVDRVSTNPPPSCQHATNPPPTCHHAKHHAQHHAKHHPKTSHANDRSQTNLLMANRLKMRQASANAVGEYLQKRELVAVVALASMSALGGALSAVSEAQSLSS
jgi:hypothetical protein